jgi:phosphate transport system substrate-binding protein
MPTRTCKSWPAALLLAAAAALVLAPLATQTACAAEEVSISGAGATFPYPLYSKWFNEYNKLHPGVKINYQSIGSGGGIRQFSEGTVYFGATDGPMTDEQLKASKVQPVVHLPMTLGAVVPIYNLPIPGLRFSGDTLARVFLGEIKTWNDPAIAKDNPGKKLPADAITIVHRSDGSGTNYIFCDFLSKVSPEFKQKVGVGASVTWPTGVGGKGNEGVSGNVQQLPGAVGYVELIYALQNKINFAAVKNAAGEYVAANLPAVSKAAAGAQIPPDYRVSITNAPGKGVYPISSFTWLLVTTTPRDAAKDKVMKDFLKWAVTDGQKFSEGLGYARLPEPLVKRELADIAKLPG